MIFDYAKIRVVVEDRRSALGALSAAIRFVWRQRGRVASLYALNGVAFLIAIAIWAVVAPGARGAGPHSGSGSWPRSSTSRQARVEAAVPRLADRAVPVGLAHAVYAATPAPAWPESPSAELIARGSSASS